MRKPDARIYGEIRGLSPEGFKELQDDMPLFSHVDYNNNVLTIEHEGYSLDSEDVENFVRAAADHLGPDGEGHLDHIDNAAWVLFRYVLSPGEVKLRRIDINDVLEPTKRG